MIAHLLQHLLLGGAVFFSTAKLTQDLSWAFVATAVNLLIDLDHLLEYYLYRRGFSFREFFSGRKKKKKGTIIIFLHAWEYVVVLLLLALWRESLGLALTAFALAAHLAFDQLSWPLHPLSYSLFWRWRVGFSLKKICR